MTNSPRFDAVQFFDRYERSLAEADFVSVASMYGSAFVFAGPQGALPVTREALIRVLPARAAQASQLGLSKSVVVGVQATELDAAYVSVRVTWDMHFAESSQRTAVEIAATYVVWRGGESPVIVFQLDHQDLAAALGS